MQSHENYIYCIFQQYLGIDLFGKSLFFNEKLNWITNNCCFMNHVLYQLHSLTNSHEIYTNSLFEEYLGLVLKNLVISESFLGNIFVFNENLLCFENCYLYEL